MAGMRKLLVTGASGFLGGHVCRAALAGWQVTALYRRHPVAVDGVDAVRVDLTVEAEVDKLLDTLRPDAVMHAAADANANHCEQDPANAFRVNVEATAQLAARCGAGGIPFLFTSTDLVFGGDHAPYRESDAPSPVNIYGFQKSEAERRVRAACPEAVICRLPLMFGAAVGPGQCFLQSHLAALAEGRSQPLFVDEFRTPVCAHHAAKGLLLVLETGAGGVFHLGGPERISRYDFGCLMADVFGLPAGSLVPSRQCDVAMPAARPADVSLESGRANALGFRPPSLREQLATVRGGVTDS